MLLREREERERERERERKRIGKRKRKRKRERRETDLLELGECLSSLDTFSLILFSLRLGRGKAVL